MKQKITKDMGIHDIVSLDPRLAEILLEAGLGCAGCGASSFETLEMGCLGHGMNQKQVNALVKMLNEFYKEISK